MKGGNVMELKDTIEGMISDDYKERFVAEYNQVRIREEKLKKIIELHCEHKLSFQPMTPIDVLVKQRLFMFRYMKVLEQRARYEGIELE